MITAPIFGISRLHIGTDGPGITTLVTLMGCPLQCKYCLNDFCHRPVFEKDGKTPTTGVSMLTPQDLYNKVKIDNLYFGMTGGGICFGGGEPALQWRFIKSFREICGPEWKITLEASLHYSEDIIKELASVVDYWIVDMKSIEPRVFESYTGNKPVHLYSRLSILRDTVGVEKVTIKIPLIPDFNDEHSVKWQYERIEATGFTHIEIINYIKRVPNINPQNGYDMNTGKELCEVLKSMRKKIAEQYGLVYEPTECHHKGNCHGTCPRCDAELKDLQRQLEEKGISHVEQDETIKDKINKVVNALKEQINRLSPSSDIETIVEEEESIITNYRTEGMPQSPIFPSDVRPLEGNIQAPPENITRFKRTLYKSCAVAGIQFHDIEDIWDELYEGAEIALVRDKNNQYDKNAVAVVLAEDYDDNPDDFDFDFILGYIPKMENEHIAMMLDMGWSELFECEISELNENCPYSERVHIHIYIRSKEEQEVFDHSCIRAKFIDEGTYEKITKDLQAKGCTYFRWVCCFPIPPQESSNIVLPNDGDNMVFICKREETTALYLMHLIATGDNAEPFVEDKEELYMTDNCQHYVFTNVKGPIIIDNDKLEFVTNEFNNNQSGDFLSKETSDRLKVIFNDIK